MHIMYNYDFMFTHRKKIFRSENHPYISTDES